MPERDGFDACVIGHVVLDRNVIAGVEQAPQPGGAAYYATATYARLGLRTAVVTRLAAADEALLLADLRSLGVVVHNLGAPCTTVFHNIDSPAADVARTQRVDREAPPIRARDLPALRSGIWHLGPLRHDDLDPDLASACRSRGGRVAIDVQGLIRRIERGRVIGTPPLARPRFERIDVVKADDAEILTLTGAPAVDAGARAVQAAGAGEVVITLADRGSILFRGDRRIDIPAYRPEREVDPTGCGDTYLAAYLTRRLATDDLEECGRFAAAAAALKLGACGRFRGDPGEVAAFREAVAASPRPG